MWTDLSRRHDDMEVLFEFAEAGETELPEIQKELRAYRKSIDDEPFGGGPGMILRPDVVEKALLSASKNGTD